MNMRNLTVKRRMIFGLIMALSVTSLMACDVADEPDLNVESKVEEPRDEAVDPVPEEALENPDPEPTMVETEGDDPTMGQPAPQGMAPGTPQPQGEVDDAQVTAFVQAFVATQPVQAEVQQKMAAVKSPEEAQKVQQEAITEIQAAVEGAGMEFEEYAMFAQRLQQDAALQQRFKAELQQVQN